MTQRLTGTEIAVPASIGNLGPGFDTLGLAVSLYLRVRVARVVPDGRGRLVCRFADGVPASPNLIARAFRVSLIEEDDLAAHWAESEGRIDHW